MTGDYERYCRWCDEAIELYGREAEYYDLFGLQYVVNNYEVDALKRIYLLNITKFPLFIYND